MINIFLIFVTQKITTMEKNSLNNKIKAYGTIAASVLGVSAVNGQIVYTDISPDATITVTVGTASTDAYTVDLNGDMTDDFSIENRVYGTSNDLVQANIMSVDSANLAMGSLVAYTSFGYAASVPSGTTIGAGSTGWNGGVQQMILASVWSGSYYGNLGDGNDHYVGVSFVDATSTYYGWIRVTGITQNGSTVTIMDYAYESTANGDIPAGATVTSIADDLNSFDAAVYSNDKDLHVISDVNDVTVNIYTVDGQLVRSEIVEKGHTVLNMADLSSGIYVVELNNNNGSITRRVNF